MTLQKILEWSLRSLTGLFEEQKQLVKKGDNMVTRTAKKKKARKSKKSGAKPTNPALYARVKAEAKRKFKVYPSAYANGWLVRTYKKRGGGYR
jgi:t-SNARE complex subunit (syntaxin)